MQTQTNSFPFWQTMISTFIGSLFGFIFSLFLFYLTDKLKRKSFNKAIIRNITKEIDFNIEYLKEINKKLQTEVVEKIMANDKNIYFLVFYERFQKFFIYDYLRTGIQYEKLSSEDIVNIEAILSKMTQVNEQWLFSRIQAWINSEIESKDVLDTFRYERSEIEKYITILEKIKNKLF